MTKTDTTSKVVATVSASAGWVKLRMEYDPSSHTSTFYVNGTQVATSDLYYADYMGDGIPAAARIFSVKNMVSHYYIDNVRAERIEKN